jgi:hypothetical protein
MIESDRQIELDERRAALRAELINLNHTTRDAVAAMLDEAKAAALTAAYKRAAWPEVYRDGQSILPALEAALALDDLPTNQRSAVYELMLEHRRDYETLCDRIIEAGSDWSARQRFSFERDELSRRAARRLRSLLSDDQVRRIGGLPG